ncbi:restriction endonuclease subunit S [Microbulbifer epialgicus]|uniref:Restriction endonuclease subunit S n=1 Tax=Microbulbifer epialgicus TaxID=393907 RepID=A0ABV4P017_9GAMM
MTQKLKELLIEHLPKQGIKSSELVTVLTMQDVDENAKIRNSVVKELKTIKPGLTYFERGDVLVAKITPCFENGKGARTDCLKTKIGFGSTEFHVLRAADKASPIYIYYVTKTKKFRSTLENLMVGSAGHRRIPLESIKNYDLDVKHSYSEQVAIANVLSDTDSLIESLEKLIAKKQAIKTATMQQLLTGKIRLPQFAKHPDGTPKGAKQSELGEIPEDWSLVTLGSVGQFSKGSGVNKAEAHSGDIPCIRYGELYTLHHNVIRQFSSFISRSVATSAKRLLKGDILFAGSGETKEEIGKAAALVSEIEAYAGGDIVILSPRGCDSAFLGYCLNSSEVITQKSSLGQGDAVVHISANALSSIRVKLPNLHEEQRAISQVISEFDEEIRVINQRLLKAQHIKQGMMQQLLTGRIRLLQSEAVTA